MGAGCDSQLVGQDCRLSEANLLNTLPEKVRTSRGKSINLRGLGIRKNPKMTNMCPWMAKIVPNCGKSVWGSINPKPLNPKSSSHP